MEQAGEWKEKLGAVTKYYLVNTYVNPTQSSFRYTNIQQRENCLSYMRSRIFTGHDDECIESTPCGRYFTFKFVSDLTKIVWSSGIGYCLINFYFHCILFDDP